MNYSDMKLSHRAFYRFATTVVKPLIALLHPLRIRGREHLPKTGPAIVIANHVAMWDVLFISRMLLPLRTEYMAKEELFTHGRFISFVLHSCGAYPVKRGTADIGAMKKALTTLKEGHVFGIFPEGTRNRNWEGSFQKFFSGVGYIALSAKAPVVPIFFSDTRGFRTFKRVNVFVGAPVQLDDLYGQKVNGERSDEATARILTAMRSLVEQSDADPSL
jgi:1-acyl-sn-glycerol-3-phosphate acyltransferase